MSDVHAYGDDVAPLHPLRSVRPQQSICVLYAAIQRAERMVRLKKHSISKTHGREDVWIRGAEKITDDARVYGESGQVSMDH